MVATLRVDVFDWDEGNADHIAEHGVSPEEAEEAMVDPRRRGAPAYNVEGERRRAMIGATDDRRVLYPVYALRHGRIRVLSARDATRLERQRYRGR